MHLSDENVQRVAEVDRREVDPPIEVETATWSPGGQLDLVGERSAQVVGSRTRCRRPSTVDQSC
jgi:hypothetical protein